jgi:hypothetical protein
MPLGRARPEIEHRRDVGSAACGDVGVEPFPKDLDPKSTG